MDPSSAPTFHAEVIATTQGDRDALGDAITDAGLAFEDWTESIEMLCAACSRGEGEHEHEGDAEPSTWKTDDDWGLPATSRCFEHTSPAGAARDPAGSFTASKPPTEPKPRTLA